MAAVDEDKPLNLLALDGGGVRGISELVILDEIMHEIKRREDLDYLPKPCEYFNLIAGTSTGGLIAIMLGRLQMSTAEALAEYDQFAEKIFSLKNMKPDLTGVFEATALEQVVQDLVTRQQKGDMMVDPEERDKGNAFVCARPSDAPDGVYRRFRSYTSDEKWGQSCKIWEAARATTAAPLYFTPMKITSGDATEMYVDAALGCNNPVKQLIHEAAELFGNKRKLGCIVSLGTGSKLRRDDLASGSGLKRLVDLGKTLKNLAVDTEKDGNELEVQLKEFSHSYFRFSVPGGAENIRLSSYKKLGELKTRTGDYIKHQAQERIKELAAILGTNATEGLTLGHVSSLDKDQLLLDTRRAIERGISSDFFIGRTQILKRLDECFSQRDPSTDVLRRRRFLLHGMGGVGKTQIALRFTEEFEDRFTHVFWIDATTEATLGEGYRKVAAEVFADDRDQKRWTSRHGIDWLGKSRDEWLLIFDNWGDGDSTDYLPKGARGNILFTSRSHEMKRTLRHEHAIEVDVMEEEDAITLLLSTAGQDEWWVSSRETAEPIVKALGYLPLAIDQAGAFIHDQDIHLDQYLDIFSKRSDELLRDDRFRGASERNRPVYTTFDMSFDALRKYSRKTRGSKEAIAGRSAVQILSTICFYHNEGITEEIFRSSASMRHAEDRRNAFPLPGEHLSPESLLDVDEDGNWESPHYELGILLLEKLSLIKLDRSRRVSSMHVLIHSWARTRMDEDTRAQLALAARAVLFDSLRFDKGAEHVIYRRSVLPHLIACEEMLPFLVKKECVLEKHLPWNNELYEAEYYSKLALVYEETNMFREAEQSLLQVIETRKWYWFYHGLDTLEAMDRLARNYRLQGRFGEAEQLLIEILERRNHDPGPGPTHPATLKTRAHLIILYKEQRQWDMAEQHMRILMEVDKEIFGEDSMKVLDDHATLLFLRSHMGDDSATLRQEILEVRMKKYDMALATYGPDSKATINAKSSLACSHSDAGRASEAAQLHREVYAARKEIFGGEGRATLLSLKNLTRALSLCLEWNDDPAKFDEVEGLHALMYATACKAFGSHHPTSLDYFLQWIIAIAGQGRVEEAISKMQECLEGNLVHFGGDHPQVEECRFAIRRLEELRPLELSQEKLYEFRKRQAEQRRLEGSSESLVPQMRTLTMESTDMTE